LSPAGERNIVDITLGGAKSPTELMIKVVGGVSTGPFCFVVLFLFFPM
jgi:hypothetical protein